MVTLATTETMWTESRIHELETRLQALEKMRAMEHIQALALRLAHLERLVQYPNTIKHPADLKGCAAQMEATQNLYAPLRSDTRAVIDLAAFARRLIDMQDLGHAVTDEVRELAKRALGLK